MSGRDFNCGRHTEVICSKSELTKPLQGMLLACAHLECDEVKRTNKLGDNWTV